MGMFPYGYSGPASSGGEELWECADCECTYLTTQATLTKSGWEVHGKIALCDECVEKYKQRRLAAQT